MSLWQVAILGLVLGMLCGVMVWVALARAYARIEAGWQRHDDRSEP